MEHNQQDVYQTQSGYGSFSQPAAVYVTDHFYDSIPEMQAGSSGVDLATVQGQVIEQQDGTYILQLDPVDKETQLASSLLQGTSSMDTEEKFVSNIDVKFCQQEMQFLHDNFESAEGSSMPRSIIYNHYTRFCRHAAIEPMNPASFGKLVRLVFAGIKTRRLGTRGNSKYHYYGIRIKATSSLSMTNSDENQSSKNGLSHSDDPGRDDDRMESDGLTMQQREHMSFLGDASNVRLDDLATLTLHDNDLLPEGVTVEDLAVFEQMYKEHCQDVLAHVAIMDLAAIPKIWQAFWQNADLFREEQDDEKWLSVEMLHILCTAECVQKFVREADCAFYTILVDIFIPDVVRPIPMTMTTVLRNFAKYLEPWVQVTTNGIAEGLVEAKMVAATACRHVMCQYTSLNYAAQAARVALHNSAVVAQLLSDINKVNFEDVHAQLLDSSSCECDERLLIQLELEMKRTLSQRLSVEEWTRWMDSVTHHILQDHIGKPDFARAAKSLTASWSTYSSLLQDALVLRSSQSVGSFLLVKPFFNGYLFYTIGQKVAAATGVSPVAAIGNRKQLIDRSTVPPLLLDGFGTTSQSSRASVVPRSTDCTYVSFSSAGGEPSLFGGHQMASGAANVMLSLQHHGGQYQVPGEGVIQLEGGDQLGITMSDQ